MSFSMFLRAISSRMELLRPLVICGPSGSGKSTLLQRMMVEYPEKFELCASHTTRAPRPGEIDGVHYHFTDKPTMMKSIADGGFVEHAQFGGNYYGTSKKAIRKVLDSGKVCILDIDTQGVRQVKQCDYHPHYVFVKPPSVDALRERLKKRETETEDSLNARLGYALSEIEYGTTEGNFDVIIVNDDFEKAVNDLKQFIEGYVLLK